MSSESIIFFIAVVTVVILGCATAIISEWIKNRSRSEYLDQYQALSSNYDTLVKEMRESQKAMQSDLAAIRQQMDSVERMIRDVG